MYQYPYGNAQQLNLDWILSKIQEIEAGSASGSDLEEVANVIAAASFDATVPYKRYDYTFYNGKLYRALNDNSGAFNPSDWTEVTIGDDVSILTRLINTAVITDVKFDTSGTNGKLQQEYGASYHDVVEVDYTPVQNSKRPLSSNAGYDLNSAINETSGLVTRVNMTDISALDNAITSGKMQFFWNRTSTPSSDENYSSGILFKSSTTESTIIMVSRSTGSIWVKNKVSNVWGDWIEIEENTALSTGTITKLITEGTLDKTTCYKIGNVVSVGARIHTISPEHTANDYFLQLPTGFIPRELTRALGIITVDGTETPIMINIGTNGQVQVSYSNTKTASQFQFAATFPI